MFYLAGFSKAEFDPKYSTSPHSADYIAAYLFTSLEEAKERIDTAYSNPVFESLSEWVEHPNRKQHYIKQFRSLKGWKIGGDFWVRLFPAQINDIDSFIMDWWHDVDKPSA